MLGFYMFFELSLLPLLFMIFGWGYQVERIQASFYLFFYTLVGSLPLLLTLLYFFNWARLLWLSFPLTVCSSFVSIFSVYAAILVSFRLIIKLPLYSLHLWLPKAHVEAPVAGSMVLAAILLKLRAYGFYRLLFFLIGFPYFLHFLLCLLVYGALISSIIALRQSDIKSLVAYSSIRHMGVILSGLLCLSSLSSKGALIILAGHAFCSSALFYLVNFHYERSHSRQIILLSGQINFFTFIAV
jgi:NADH-ubiquinone oxidoreductase chain 4